MKNEALILALVPGRINCGIARVAADGAAVWRRVVPRSQLERTLNELSAQLPEIVLVTSGHQSKTARGLLIQIFGAERVRVVEDQASRSAARSLYFADHPPSGLWKLVPRSLITPSKPIDDYFAVVLARHWIAHSAKK